MKKLKQWLALFVTLSCFTTVNAYDFEVDGIYYECVNSNSNQVRVVSATLNGDIIIPQKVEYNNQEYIVSQIGDNAFSNCDNLKSLVIPQSVTYIGYKIINGCTSLEKLILEDGITTISFYDQSRPFNGPSNLKEVYIGRQFNFDSGSVFAKYSNLTDVTIGVETIEGNMFSSCTIQNLYFEDNVKDIAEKSFQECTFDILTIPENIISIGHDAFYNSKIKKIVIEDFNTPLSLEYRNNSEPLFLKSNVESLYLGRNLDYIDPNISPYILPAFSCSSTLKEIIVGDLVTGLGAYCFRTMYVEDLKYVFGKNIEKIGYSCFGNSLLEEFIIPEGVKYIDDYAFEQCPNLEKIVIPESVISIGKDVFRSCSKIVEFSIKSKNPFQVATMSGFSTTATLTVPNGTAKAYSDLGGFWGQFANIQEEVDINISANNQWSTCALAFDAELPTGVQAFTANGIRGEYLILEESASLEAYTPYILYAENGYEGTLTGIVDVTNYQERVSEGLLNGAITTQQTSTGYVMQNQGNGAMFYNVSGETFSIPAGKCWLDPINTGVATVRMSFGTTGIEEVKTHEEVKDGTIYSLDGKVVTNPEKGKIYIIGGKKVLKM